MMGVEVKHPDKHWVKPTLKQIAEHSKACIMEVYKKLPSDAELVKLQPNKPDGEYLVFSSNVGKIRVECHYLEPMIIGPEPGYYIRATAFYN